MKVTLIEEDKKGWFIFGKEYAVLSIEIYGNGGEFIYYRMMSDEGTCPVLMSADLFRITSNKLSASWVFSKDGESYCSIVPEKWARDGFWDDYHNDELEAIADLENERDKIFAEEGVEGSRTAEQRIGDYIKGLIAKVQDKYNDMLEFNANESFGDKNYRLGRNLAYYDVLELIASELEAFGVEEDIGLIIPQLGERVEKRYE